MYSPGASQAVSRAIGEGHSSSDESTTAEEVSDHDDGSWEDHVEDLDHFEAVVDVDHPLGGHDEELGRSELPCPRRHKTDYILHPWWVCQSTIVVVWLWMVGFQLLADRWIADGIDVHVVCSLHAAGRIPYSISFTWMAFLVADFDLAAVPLWWIVQTAGAFTRCSVKMSKGRLLGLQGSLLGTLMELSVEIVAGLLLMVFARVRRKKLAAAVGLWFGLLHGVCRSLAADSYCLEQLHIVVFRALLPLYEVITRKSFVFLWRRFRADASETVLSNVIVVNVLIVEVFQIASFAATAQSSHAIHSAVMLSVVSVFSDYLSRSKLLHMLLVAAWCRKSYRVDYAADLSLRARWWYVYLLLPPIVLLLGGWHLWKRPMSRDLMACIAMYFVSSVISDVVFLLWQHGLYCAYEGRQTLHETLSRVRGPRGHLVPQICRQRLKGRPPHPPTPRASIGGTAADFLGLCPRTWSGMYLASVSSYWLYLIFSGVCIPSFYCWRL